MPTGYTACIEDGATFEQFLWGCARGMGACVMMRDDSWDEPIPEAFEPSNFYREKVQELEKEIHYLNGLPDEAISERQVADNAKIRADNERRRLKHEENQRRYRAIRERVIAWHPPTADHEGLKAFMLQQIETSTRGWGGADYYKEEEKRIVSAEEWRKAKIAETLKNLTREKDELNKELERTAGRNLWLKQLRSSVPQVSPFKKSATS